MNRNLLINFLGLILCGCLLGCNEEADQQVEDNSSLSPTKYKIDGNFDDWKTYETMETCTGIDWSRVVTDSNFDEILLKEIYYDNDSNYLYLFFKFQPSIQERYDKTHEVPDFGGELYFDTDMNTNTGCTDFDTENTSPPPGVSPNEWASGEGTIPGAEVKVGLEAGFHSNPETSGCTVAYEIEQWDSAAKTFVNHTVRKENSRAKPPLIAFGKDGVEVALLLSDLQLTMTNKFALSFWSHPIPSDRENVNRKVIQLK